MELSIKCCEYFNKIRHHFNWYSYQNESGEKVRCMPSLTSSDGCTVLRINHCPSCGKEIRNIEMK